MESLLPTVLLAALISVMLLSFIGDVQGSCPPGYYYCNDQPGFAGPPGSQPGWPGQARRKRRAPSAPGQPGPQGQPGHPDQPGDNCCYGYCRPGTWLSLNWVNGKGCKNQGGYYCCC